MFTEKKDVMKKISRSFFCQKITQLTFSETLKMEYQIELGEAIKIAKEAGEIIKKAFNSYQCENLEFKDDNAADLVTSTDKQVELLIKQHFISKFPSYKVIGEESVNGTLNPSIPTWIIDPIDGTTNFVHGLPFICVSIALVFKHSPIVAVVFNPILNECYTAIKNQGAFLNNVRLPLKFKAFPISLSECLACSEFGSDRRREQMTIKTNTIDKILNSPARGLRAFGSAALQSCFVARGSLDFFWEAGIHCWDIAAGMLIVQESGGLFMNYGNESRLDRVDLGMRRYLAIRPFINKEIEEERVVELILPLLDHVEYDRDAIIPRQ